MKLSFTLLLCFFTFSMANAQTFDWSHDGDTLSVEPKDTDLSFGTMVKNNTATPVELMWWVQSFTTPGSGWQHYHCSGIICWPTNEPSDTLKIGAGDSTDFDAHIMMLSDIGTGSMTVCIYDIQDSANSNNCRTFTAITDTTIGIADAQIEDNRLKQNAPNPFKESTVIRYENLTTRGTLRIHNLAGKLVDELNLTGRSGSVTVGQGLDSGLYFYTLLDNGQVVATRQMQVID